MKRWRRRRGRKHIRVEAFTVNVSSDVFPNDQPYENGVDIQVLETATASIIGLMADFLRRLQ
jgi:hypothetical protein